MAQLSPLDWLTQQNNDIELPVEMQIYTGPVLPQQPVATTTYTPQVTTTDTPADTLVVPGKKSRTLDPKEWLAQQGGGEQVTGNDLPPNNIPLGKPDFDTTTTTSPELPIDMQISNEPVLPGQGLSGYPKPKGVITDTADTISNWYQSVKADQAEIEKAKASGDPNWIAAAQDAERDNSPVLNMINPAAMLKNIVNSAQKDVGLPQTGDLGPKPTPPIKPWDNSTIRAYTGEDDLTQANKVLLMPDAMALEAVAGGAKDILQNWDKYKQEWSTHPAAALTQTALAFAQPFGILKGLRGKFTPKEVVKEEVSPSTVVPEVKPVEQTSTTPKTNMSSDFLNQAHDAAERGDYRQATILANKAGDPIWEQTYANMAKKEQPKTEAAATLEPKTDTPQTDTIIQKLNEKINETIEPVQPAIGLSLKEVKNTPKAETEQFEFSDSEVESRYQEATKGIQKPSLINRVKDGISKVWARSTREYEHLPHTAEFAPLRYDLLKLEKQKGVANDKTVRILQGLTIDLDKPGMDLFTRKVIFDDLAHETGELPFGLTKESLGKEKVALDNAVINNPKVAEAVNQRSEVWKAITNDYSKSMKDIGFDVSDRLNRPDYFRHQVLEYANARAIAGTGSKLKTPTNRGFLKGREGSAKDINANYLQAEYEVMAQMMYDSEIAKTWKKIDENYNIRKQLTADHKDQWRENIPQGYTTIQPREGSAFYLAQSIPEKLATKLLGGELEALIKPEQVKTVLAKGSPFKEMVVKQEVADTLNKLGEPPMESTLGKISRTLITPWKVWTLISPTRAIKYNLRNLTGDADMVFAANPSAFRKAPQAVKELYQVFYGDRAMTPEMREWFNRGGMQTLLQVQELGDINNLRVFKNFAENKGGILKAPAKAWDAYWNTARTATDFREAIMRYATYLDYVKQMEKSGGKPRNFGASKPEEVMALPDIRDKAFKLSNELLGAYDAVSVLGKEARTHIAPFWSWYETNFKRYTQFFKNQAADGTLAAAVGRKILGTGLRYTVQAPIMAGSFVIKAGALWAAVQAYNTLVFPEEEKSLPPDEQARFHLILGRDADGKVRYFNRLGSFSDFLEWFGVDTPVKDVKDLLNGTRTLKEIAVDMAKSAPNKLVQSVSPTIKMPAELLAGKQYFPDAFNARSIKDTPQYIFNSFGTGNEFKAFSRTAAGKAVNLEPRPGKPYFAPDTAENFAYYKADPNQVAYYNLQDKKRQFMEKGGKGMGDAGFETPKSKALRNYKAALRYNDEESADYYYKQYKDAGGKDKDLDKSIKALDPLYGLNNKERKEFIESLSGQDRLELQKAVAYYKTVLETKKDYKKK